MKRERHGWNGAFRGLAPLLALLIGILGCGGDIARDTGFDAADPYAGLEGEAVGSLAVWDRFLDHAGSLSGEDRAAALDRLWGNIEAVPVYRDSTVLFLYRGEADRVVIAGDMNSWNPDRGIKMKRLAGTNLWHARVQFEPATRLDYKLVIDGGRWIVDPRNPRTILGGFGPNSELRMPGYESPWFLDPRFEWVDGAAPAGKLHEHTIWSEALDENRRFAVYTPHDWKMELQKPSPTLYLNDGGDYLRLIDTPVLLDRMIARGTIPPLVAVFIDPADRRTEYVPNEKYLAFLTDELVPFVQWEYRTDPGAGRTAILGVSMGGLSSVYAGVARPDVFGLVGAHSGAFTYAGGEVLALAESAPSLPHRIALTVGTYERAVSGNANEGNLLGAQRRLAAILAKRGANCRVVERPEGHSWGLWRGDLDDTLGFLFSVE